jgi:Domain of unknown function (DUF4404)
MSELHQTLQRLHEELRRAERLDPDDRAVLESLLGDIRRLLETTQSSPAARPSGDAMPHGDALEGAAVRLEAGHPGVAGAIRAVLDALGKAGI